MHRPTDPTTPIWQRHRALTPHRFRLIPFRSPLLRESLLLYFPRVTEMFQFTRLPLPALCVQTGVAGHYPSWVSPFGHPRIGACLAASRGFRSLLRPSSAASDVYKRQVQTGVAGHYPSWVFPFGHPRIGACLAASRGFRSLLRPTQTHPTRCLLYTSPSPRD